jgi:putative transposase
VVRRLVALEEMGRLGVEEVELAADGLGVSSRSVWRWVRQARAGEGLDCRPRGRFGVTDEVRQRLAFWRGNAAAVHRELVEAARNGGPAAPSLSTLQRAVARDVLAGDRAGLAGGERARRAFDVFLQRPRAHRNAVWEADHVQAAVEVDVEGRLLKPWVTWFVDAGTNVVCGLAVTPGPASRESVLAGLRAAITLEEPYGPPGGLPERVRIDRGKDFLSRTVASVLAGFAVTVEDLPAYMPHLKGSVETVNGGNWCQAESGQGERPAQALLGSAYADVDHRLFTQYERETGRKAQEVVGMVKPAYVAAPRNNGLRRASTRTTRTESGLRH